MHNKIIPLIIAATVFAVGCEQLKQSSNGPEPVVKKEDAVAIVNGKYIGKDTLQELEKEIQERSHGQKFPKEKLVEELIRREILIQDAKKNKLDQTPEFLGRLTQVKQSLLTQAALQHYLENNPVTDEEIKAEYDKKVGASNNEEFKARHILVKTEEEANNLIKELDKGAKFEDLATQNSTGPSGPKGGDLGWFVASQMVPPFSAAVQALENGKYTSVPVKTQFGWHVILREDSRTQTAPPLEAVKEQMLPFLQRQKVQTMLDNLRQQAKVEILIPLEEQKAQPAPIKPPSIEDKAKEDTSSSAEESQEGDDTSDQEPVAQSE